MPTKRILVLRAQPPFACYGAARLANGLARALQKQGFAAQTLALPYQNGTDNTYKDSLFIWRMLNLQTAADAVIATDFPSCGAEHPYKVVWLLNERRHEEHDRPAQCAPAQPEGTELQGVRQRYEAAALESAKRVFSVSAQTVQNHKSGGEVLCPPPPLAGRYFCEAPQKYLLAVLGPGSAAGVQLALHALQSSEQPLKLKMVLWEQTPQSCMELAKELGLEHRVEFLSKVEDAQLLQLYANAFAVLHMPTAPEDVCTALEGFASQKPVLVASEEQSIWQHGQSALCCPPKAQPLAAGINALYQNEGLYQTLKAGGGALLQEVSWGKTIKKLLGGLADGPTAGEGQL